jgi:hypothetical protein
VSAGRRTRTALRRHPWSSLTRTCWSRRAPDPLLPLGLMMLLGGALLLAIGTLLTQTRRFILQT